MGCEASVPKAEAPADSTYALVQANTANAIYVGDASCATCHEDLAARYAAHPKAQSFHQMTADRVLETFDGTAIYDDGEDLYYTAFRQGERFFQHAFRLDADGDTTHVRTEPVTHVVKRACTRPCVTTARTFYRWHGTRK